VAAGEYQKGFDVAAQARSAVGIPLGRPFPSADADDPWVHITEPRIEVAALTTHVGSVFGPGADRGMTLPSGAAGLATLTWHNALSRWGSQTSLDVDTSVGAIQMLAGTTPAARANLTTRGDWIGGDIDFARVLDGSGHGGAFVGRIRVGRAAGLHVTLRATDRDGVDPVAARALADPTLEPATGFLASNGWGGTADASVPLGPRVTVRGGSTVDIERATMVAAVGSIEVHDSCRCTAVRLTSSNRIGRDGVDVWLTVDLAR
jgi:hypothetical protein